MRYRSLLLLLMLSLPTILFSQLDTGTIVGTVVDSSGLVIPAASVLVQNVETGSRTEATTDGSGNFVAPALRVGAYRVTVTVGGFQTHIQEGIRLSVNDRLNLSISLKPGAVTEQITIVGEAPVLETASTTLGAVVTQQQVTDLPLSGRAVDQLFALAPGVVSLGGRRSVSGQTLGLWNPGIRWLVDGGDSSQIDSDLASGGYGSAARVNRVSVDGVAEFRQVTSMYSAEYGQSAGGVVNFISRSGTNEFHGGLFHFFRNNALDAREFFNTKPNPQPPFRMNQFGGTFGGPIIRDKLFFFGNYEGVRQKLGVIYNTFVFTPQFRATLDPALRSAADMLPLPNGPVSATEPRLAQLVTSRTHELNEDTWMAKVDYQATSKDRFSFRHNFNKSFNLNYFGVAEGQFRNIPSLPQTSMINYTRTFSPTVLNQFGVFLNRLDVTTEAAGTDAIRAFPQTNFGQGAASVGPGTWDMDVRNTSFTFLETLSWIKGSHQFKFGVQIVRMRANKLVNDQKFVTFQTLNDVALNRPFSLRTEGWPRPGVRGTQNDLYVQDDFKVNRSLTMNVGVRYKYDTTPTEAYGRIANFDVATGKVDPPGTPLFSSPKANFAPRVGLAYTPFGSQKTVIRAGYGLFHVYLNAAEVQFLPTNVAGFGNRYEFNIQSDPSIKAFPFPDISRFPAATTKYAFNKDWRRAYTQQWNLNIQRSILDQNTIVQIGYVGSNGVNLNRAIQGNLFVPGTTFRRIPGVGSIDYQIGGSNSSYHSLQTAFKRRMSRGLQFDAYYTWSHAMDNGFGNGQIPWDRRAEWASADHDARHNLTFSYLYELPRFQSGPNWLLNGWQINGITSMRSGHPVTPTTNRDPFGIGVVTARANIVPGVEIRPTNYDIATNQFNIAAFAPPPNGQWGNAGRNILVGPAAFNWNMSLFKRFQVTERQRVEFRAEAFNLFNTPQFNPPSSAITSPATFGRSLSTISASGGFGSYRQIQLGLKYNF